MLNICTKFEFLISQGSVATCLRWGGYFCLGFVANFTGFPAVQTVWKSVKIWQSYREFKGGNFFWDTMYMCLYPLSLRVPLYAPQPVVILWYHGQDDDLACGHSVSLVVPPGTIYQQTFELHWYLQTLNNILRHICLFDPTIHLKVRAVDFEWRPCSDFCQVMAPYKLLCYYCVLCRVIQAS